MTDTLTAAKGRTAIIDAHLHLYDGQANRFGIFERRDVVFESFVGDYAAMPRRFLIEDYIEATAARQVEGVIWHEFMSADPIAEACWAQRIADTACVPMALVGLVDLQQPDLEARLDIYRTLPNLTGVRQHLLWDPVHPLRRFAPRPDLMTDPAWLAGLARLNGTDLRCGLEVCGPQLPELTRVVRAHPDIAFTVAVMGWPIQLDREGFERWRADFKALSHCPNVCASISAVECIFGLGWSEEQVRPWILAIVETFGPSRCMLGSHLPISALSHGFDALYETYERIFAGCSKVERTALFSGTARDWFRLPRA